MACLEVFGARQHNLKNISVRLPKGSLVVITGPSGSGKSSLAFDTIYAEGQRRYVESLSVYARQFLEQLPKPDVDAIEGLSPAIAIEQRPMARNPRSTVGTITEIADHLRVLFARLGTPHCPVSGERLIAYTAEEIVDSIMQRDEGSKLVLMAPIVRQQTGDLSAEIERLRSDGFARARLDGQAIDLSTEPAIDPNPPHDLEVIVDRLVRRSGIRGRLTDSVELALRLGNGTVLLDFMDGEEPTVMSEQLVSWEHGARLPKLEPRLFSFNSPQGACPHCDGLGTSSAVDVDRLIRSPELSLKEGAIAAFGRPGTVATAAEVDLVVRTLDVDPDVPWKDLPAAIRSQIFHGSQAGAEPDETESSKKGRSRRKTRAAYEGAITRLQARIDSQTAISEAEVLDDGAPDAGELRRFFRSRPCEHCGGSRLRPEALNVTLGEKHIAEWCDLPLSELRDLLDGLSDSFSPSQQQLAEPLAKAVQDRLGFLLDVGLGYLTLSRSANSLSGGEAQRIRLATQLGASLSGVLYVLDEPSIGLHARDNDRLLSCMRNLVNKGNSVLVVEHDRDAMLEADYLLELGPRAGRHGGEIIAQGTPDEIRRQHHSSTGRYLAGESRLTAPAARRQPNPDRLNVLGANANNLKQIDCDIPVGLLTVVTGVSGSGKSSLIVDTLLNAVRANLSGDQRDIGACREVQGLEFIDKALSIDQAPIGRTPRSNPATYSGLFGHLRTLYASLPEARTRGYQSGRFSFNVKGGRCEKCKGDGLLRVEMHFLPDAYVECDACQGKRYNRETLEISYRGLSIADALELTVDQASDCFDTIPRLREGLSALRRVGLGYLQLGQPATTLSGGEAQRLKLATELAKRSTGRTLYVLDEPTTGLHFSDIESLLAALFALRDEGNTIVLIEHNLDVVDCADWVIDLGPDGGTGGGEIIFSGTPDELARHAGHTGRYLERHREPPRVTER